MILLTILFASILSGKPTPMYEPIFAVDFDTSKVKFEPMDPVLRASCKLPTAQPWWVFAHAKSGTEEVFVASGFRLIKPDGPSKSKGVLQPDFGVVVKVRGGSCAVVNIDNGFSEDLELLPKGKGFPLTIAERTALAKDMAERYKKAFGGRRALFQALDKDSLGSEDRPSEFGEALRALTPE